MKIIGAVLLSLAMSASARAESVPSTQDGLKAWLDAQPLVLLKIQGAVARAHALPAPIDSPDLKDAVASSPLVDVPKSDSERRELMERLPGMAPAPLDACRASSCAGAPPVFHVDNVSSIQEAVVALVQPWILLQKDRKQDVSLEAAADPGDRIMNVKLGDLSQSSLAVYVAPSSAGGYEVWPRRTQSRAGLIIQDG